MEGGVATWVDRNGCKRSAVAKGQNVVLRYASWRDGRSQMKSAPVDHTGERLLLVDQFWLGSFTDEKGARVRLSTWTADKANAQRIANKWESDACLRSEGVIDPLGDALASHASQPITKHVDEFIAFRATAEEHPKVIQTVMRHGTITLTMDTYGHLFPGQTENAPKKLAAMMQKTPAAEASEIAG